MSRVITFSRNFPSYHPKAGQPTFFMEKIWKSLGQTYAVMCREQGLDMFQAIKDIDTYTPKYHTIREGRRFKKGDLFSPRVWLEKPYRSKQVTFAPDIEVKKTWDIEIRFERMWQSILIEGELVTSQVQRELATNDGLTVPDLVGWFNKPMIGQIICHGESINY